MKSRLKFIILFILFVSTGCISKQMRALKNDEQNDVALIVVADRGASDVAPENTLAAFDKAQELGALAIQTDVQLSKDGRVVVFRDETLDEKTNLKGPVASHKWAELAAVDFAHWFNVTKRIAGADSHQAVAETNTPKPSQKSRALDRYRLSRRTSPSAAKKISKLTSLSRLITLGDVFERYGLTFQYDIVLHASDPTGGSKLAAATLKIIKEYGISANAVIASSDYDLLTELHKSDPAAVLCYLVDETKTPDINAEIQRAVSSGFQQLGIRTPLVTHDYVKRARSVNIKIFAYDRASDDQIVQAAKVGAASVATPMPDHTSKMIEAASKIHY